ncbi:MAG: hypothetical protein HY765_05500 [Rhodomicrobium sp.]|nr:hypothetical protein [Rhodomicrobium sp.]
MILAPDSFERQQALEGEGSRVSAGIIQMYRPKDGEARTENPVPVRFAGVPNQSNEP